MTEARRRTRASPDGAPRRLAGVCWAFLRLGLVSFGGPVAHLGYFRDEFVGRRRWLGDEDFADLVALCQFLPGPASSQVAFAIGMRRAGLAGGILASGFFLLPSAALMVLFAYLVGSLGAVGGAGWLHGLKLAAVAVVAQAVVAMAGRLCPDWTRRALGLGAAAAVLLLPGTATPAAAIAACALAGWAITRGWPAAPAVPAAGGRDGRILGAILFAAFLVLLVLLPVLAGQTGSKPVAVFGRFYRAGSLVFGGGHVVLPLLRSAVVPPGWVSDGTFLAGYGAAQALPGPLFAFAGYLGTVIHGAPNAWTGGLLALLAIYLPGWLLVAGAYPYWHFLRSKAWIQAAIRGAHCAVVGILLAALFRPLFTESVRDVPDAAAAIAGFLLLRVLRLPPWALVALAAAAGQWLLR